MIEMNDKINKEIESEIRRAVKEKITEQLDNFINLGIGQQGNLKLWLKKNMGFHVQLTTVTRSPSA